MQAVPLKPNLRHFLLLQCDLFRRMRESVRGQRNLHHVLDRVVEGQGSYYSPKKQAIKGLYLPEHSKFDC